MAVGRVVPPPRESPLRDGDQAPKRSLGSKERSSSIWKNKGPIAITEASTISGIVASSQVILCLGPDGWVSPSRPPLLKMVEKLG